MRGKIANASNAAELNAALHSVLAGAWMSLDAKGQFYATFRLRPDSEPLKRGVLPEFGYGPVYKLDGELPVADVERESNRTPHFPQGPGLRHPDPRAGRRALIE